MKGRLIFLGIEITAVVLLLLVFSIKAGAGLLAALYTAAVVLLCAQMYFLILKPLLSAMKEMEAAVEESKNSAQIRKEFVANVSHELKTPLTSISGFIETLQDGAAEDPEIRTKFIDIIAIETSRLKRLIEDLLVLSDIESRRDHDGAAFDVREEVEETVDTLGPIAKKKNIEIIMELEEGLTLRGSADRFRQMMVNLIENAIKYSEENGHVLVSAVTDADRIVVSVRDEGIGIAPEHHERLFERFYRVDKSRSTKAGGTGLGLSIVKHIAVLFGATLKVESEIGKGAVFYVTFHKEEGIASR